MFTEYPELPPQPLPLLFPLPSPPKKGELQRGNRLQGISLDSNHYLPELILELKDSAPKPMLPAHPGEQ